MYDTSKTVDSVFNQIQGFQDLCTLIKNEKTDAQLVSYAYIVFQRTGIFMESLRQWNNKLPADKTFTNFKIFMHKESFDLQEVGGLTVQNSSINLIKQLENVSSTVKAEVRNGILETMKAFNLSAQSQHQEHLNSNYGFCRPSYSGIVGTTHALNVWAQNQNQENINRDYVCFPPLSV